MKYVPMKDELNFETWLEIVKPELAQRGFTIVIYAEVARKEYESGVTPVECSQLFMDEWQVDGNKK